MRFPEDMISRGLVAVVALLAVIVVSEVAGIALGSSPAAENVDGAVAADASAGRADAASDLYPPLGSFSEILKRPLTETTRRQPQALTKADVGVSAAQLRQKWRISGIVLYENNIAILESTRPAETRSLVVGQVLEGWRVSEITETHVVVARGSETVRFDLHEPGAGNPVSVQKRITQVFTPSRQ